MVLIRLYAKTNIIHYLENLQSYYLTNNTNNIKLRKLTKLLFNVI